MDWTNSSLTDVGRALIAECQGSGLALNITNCSTSSHDYSSSDISTLTALEDIEQTVAVSEKYGSGDSVRVVANFDNTSITTSYNIYSYGLYANNGGSDVLLLVGCTDSPVTVPAISEVVWQALFDSVIKIDNAPTITITVNPAYNATQEYVQNYVKDKLESVTTITIPADDTTNYTTLQDKDGVDYYYIDIPVTGMTEDYVGTNALTPKMIDPSDTTNFSISEWEEVRDTYFAMIMSMWSYNGYVRAYMYELPDIDFQVQLYGV